MTYYISGPMSGVPGLNRPSFEVAANYIERRGHVVILPAWHETLYKNALTMDVQNICRHADALYMLHGWEHSPRAERAPSTRCAVALNLPTASRTRGTVCPRGYIDRSERIGPFATRVQPIDWLRPRF